MLRLKCLTETEALHLLANCDRSAHFACWRMVAWEHPDTAGVPVFPERKDKGTVGIPRLPGQG